MMTGLKVRFWMMEQNLKSTEIAEEYGCTDSFISKFIKGEKPSKPLVDYLIDKGCPEEHFKNGRVAA